jgi:hypothetical protein
MPARRWAGCQWRRPDLGRVPRSPMSERALPKLIPLLGLVQLAVGCWIMFATESFGETIASFDGFNAHDLRDFATFYLALGIVLLVAAVRLDERRILPRVRSCRPHASMEGMQGRSRNAVLQPTQAARPSEAGPGGRPLVERTGAPPERDDLLARDVECWPRDRCGAT